MRAIIYFEGHKKLRSGFRDFFDSYYNGSSGKRIKKLIACGGTPIEDFLTGFQSDIGGSYYHILLIDSDILKGSNYRQAVRNTTTWKEAGNVIVEDNQLHFMVQKMEAWFMADKDALIRYYADNFKLSKLPRRMNVEEIPADDLIKKLNEATKDTKKRKYENDKAGHGSKILSLLDPRKVINAAPHCAVLFETLDS